MSRIRVLIKDPGQKAREWNIENQLETLQSIVGGYIEMIPIGDTMAMIVDEEGKLKGKKWNFDIHGGADCIVGTCIFTGVDGEDMTGLDDYQIRMLRRKLEA